MKQIYPLEANSLSATKEMSGYQSNQKVHHRPYKRRPVVYTDSVPNRSPVCL
jgi:hypothetical protein